MKIIILNILFSITLVNCFPLQFPSLPSRPIFPFGVYGADPAGENETVSSTIQPTPTKLPGAQITTMPGLSGFPGFPGLNFPGLNMPGLPGMNIPGGNMPGLPLPFPLLPFPFPLPMLFDLANTRSPYGNTPGLRRFEDDQEIDDLNSKTTSYAEDI